MALSRWGLVRLSALRITAAPALGAVLGAQPVRNKVSDVQVPKPGGGKQYRRIVHFPEKYTTEPLRVTKLGGRDPVTGRKVVEGVGGGRPVTFLWVDLKRVGPKEGPPLVEKVLKILECYCHTAFVALVASGEHMRYVLATEHMKPGDLIRTSGEIPRIAVRANEGDSHPLGALPVGSLIHCVERKPTEGGVYCIAAGTCATLLRKIGDKCIVSLPSKHEVCLSQECMATVGRVSNVEHGSTPIGSAQRMRFLGGRPRSGLWHRKEGRHGRKLRLMPAIKDFTVESTESPPEVIKFSAEPRIKQPMAPY